MLLRMIWLPINIWQNVSNFNWELWLTAVGLTWPEPCVVIDGLTILVDYLEPALLVMVASLVSCFVLNFSKAQQGTIEKL